jgi:hypothetical protein
LKVVGSFVAEKVIKKAYDEVKNPCPGSTVPNKTGGCGPKE